MNKATQRPLKKPKVKPKINDGLALGLALGLASIDELDLKPPQDEIDKLWEFYRK